MSLFFKKSRVLLKEQLCYLIGHTWQEFLEEEEEELDEDWMEDLAGIPCGRCGAPLGGCIRCGQPSRKLLCLACQNRAIQEALNQGCCK